MKFDYTQNTGQITEKNTAPLTPHPDGQAWPKSCKNIDGHKGFCCAFVKAQESGARLTLAKGGGMADAYPLKDNPDKLKAKDVPFFCAHRLTEDGHHRVCAGWDACFGNKHHESRK